MLAVQEFLYSHCISGSVMQLVESVSVQPDSFLQKIQISIENPPQVVAEVVQKGIIMNYAGNVSRTYVANKSLFLCEAFGQQFFVSAGQFGNIDFDGFVPAWLVPENKKCQTKPAPKKKREAEDKAAAAKPVDTKDANPP